MNNSVERDNDGGDDDERDGESIVGEWGGIDDIIDRDKYKIECVSVALTRFDWRRNGVIHDTNDAVCVTYSLPLSLDRTFVRSFVLPSPLNLYQKTNELP